MTAKARRVVRELFDAFFNDPTLMPDEHEATGARLELVQGPAGRARAVADYIAGHDRSLCHSRAPPPVRTERANLMHKTAASRPEERSAAARPAARAHAAPADLADAPGGPLSAGVPGDARARRRFPGDVHHSRDRLRNHAAAGRPLSAGCRHPVLGHSHDSARDESRTGVRGRRGSEVRAPGAHAPPTSPALGVPDPAQRPQVRDRCGGAGAPRAGTAACRSSALRAAHGRWRRTWWKEAAARPSATSSA